MLCPWDAAGEDADGVGSSWTGWSCLRDLVDPVRNSWDRIDPARDASDQVLGDMDEVAEVPVH